MLATDAACETVMVDAADLPPDVAVIVAVPSATAVTVPSDETLATVGLELDHVILALPFVPPFTSLAIALS